MHHFLVGSASYRQPARVPLVPACKSFARSKGFLSNVTSEALLASSPFLVGGCEYQEIACAVWPMVSSMTRDAHHAGDIASPWPPETPELCAVTDFRCEATDKCPASWPGRQPSNSLGEFQVKRLFHQGNEKFIARRSHAMSATRALASLLILVT